MEGHPLTRRRFVTNAGTLAAAAAVLGPRAALAKAGGTPTLAGGFAEGVMSGDPTPTGITLWTRARRGRRHGDGGARGRPRQGLQQDRRAAPADHQGRRRTLGQGAHPRPGPLRAVLLPLLQRATTTAAWGAFAPRCPRTRGSRCASPSSPARSSRFGFYNAHALLSREDVDFVINLGDYIYSDVAFGPPIGVREAKLRRRRSARARATASATAPTAATPRCARCTPPSR